MIIMFIIGTIIDHIRNRKLEKERAESEAKYLKTIKRDYSNGYKVRMDIPYRGKYNDIY